MDDNPEDRLSKALERTADPVTRAFWVPQVANPDEPTDAELALGVPIGELVDDGIQFVRDDSLAIDLALPSRARYKVIYNPDGSVDVFPEDPNTIVLISDPDWIVFRPAPDVQPEWLCECIDGWWLDRRGLPVSGTMIHQGGAVLRFAPTGRFEERDGVVAEVYEVRPWSDQ